MEDITKVGVTGLKGLKGIKGVDKVRQIKAETMPMPTYDKEGNIIDESSISDYSQDIQLSNTYDLTGDLEGTTKSNTGDLGSSVYDKNILTEDDLSRVAENRADSQSALLKVTNGIAKGTVLAGTTFADGMLGSIAGIANVIYTAVNKEEGEEVSYLDAFVNNPLSNLFQSINEASESVLPNYYSKAEQEEPWYSNVFTANFIGDKFIKNTGFTIGAALAATQTSGVFNKLLSASKYREAFKGAVMLGSSKVSPNQILQAYNAGDATLDGIKLTKDLAKAAKQLRNAEYAIKTASAINAAMGEGRIEAITNGNQYKESIEKPMTDAFNEEYEGILYKEAMRNPSKFTVVIEDGEQKIIPIDLETYNMIEGKKQFLKEEYENNMAELEANRAKMSNAVFVANLGILTTSNLYQWGKFLGGGFKTGRLNTASLSGNMADGFTASKYIKAKGYAKALSNPLMEAQEEMSQSLVSETSGLYYGSQFNSFYGAKIVPDAEEETVSFLNAFANGFKGTYGNINTWEEGFLGFLTGALGIPSFTFGKQASNGKIGIIYNNEMLDEFRETKEANDNSIALAEEINNRIKSDEFINYYQGMIRHNALQKTLDEHLINNDNFEYKNVEHAQLISDIMMFDKAGRISDLYDTIEQAGNITEEDVDDIRKDTIDKETGKSIFDGKLDSEVVEHIKKEAGKYEKVLDNYRKISDSLITLYGEDLQEDLLQELTYITSQINNLEDRFKQLNEDSTSIFDVIRDNTGNTFTYKGKSINDMNTQELLDLYSNEDAIDSINDYIRDNNKNKILSNLDVDTSIKNIQDLNKIHNYRKSLIATYDALSKNPELFSNARKDLINTINAEILNKETTINTEKLKDDMSLNGIENIIKENPTKKDLVIESLLKSKDESVKVLANKFKERESALNYTLKILNNKYTEDEELLEAISEDMNEGINNFNSINEYVELLKEKSEEYKDSNPILYDKYNDIAKELENAFNIEKATKPDSKRDKRRKENKGKGRLSLSDMTSNTLEESDNKARKELEEDNKEDKEDTNKPVDDSNTETSEESPAEDNSKTQEESTEKNIEGSTTEKSSTQQEDKELNKEEGSTPNAEKPVENKTKKYLNINKKEVFDAIMNSMHTISSEDLQKLLSNEYEIIGGSKSERDSVRFIIKKELDNRKNSLNPDMDNTEELEYDKNNKIINDNFINRFGSYTVTEHQIEPLKKGILVDYNTPETALLKDLGAYSFVDRGDLGKLFRANPNLPIYFVVTNKESALSSRVLLAIKVDESFNKEGVKPIRQISIGDSNYQIVGTLGFNAKNKEDLDDFMVLKNSLVSQSNNAEYYTDPNKTTTINHIFSGRIATSNSTTEKEQRPLSINKLNDIPHGFMFNYSTYNQKYVGVDVDNAVPLNTLSNNDKSGSLWLYTYGADGFMYPKALKIKRFNQEELDSTFTNSALFKRLYSAVETLMDESKGDLVRAKAKYEILDILYLKEDNTILFTNGNVSIKGIRNNIGIDVDSLEEKKQEFLVALMAPELGARFQIKPSYLENEVHRNELIESGVITTDLIDYGHHNASFTLNGLSNTAENKAERVVYNADKKDDVTVIVNGATYRVNKDGVFKKDTKVTDVNKLKEVELEYNILQGNATIYPGSSNLYIGYYKTGEEFGIVNGKVIQGILLSSMKQDADKKERRKRNTNTSSIDINNALNMLDNRTQEEIEELRMVEESLLPEYAAFLENNKKPEPKTMQVSETPTTIEVVGDSFNSNIRNALLEDSFTPQKALAKHRNAIRSIKGVSNITDFIKYAKSKGIDITTLTSQEEVDNAVDMITKCL